MKPLSNEHPVDLHFVLFIGSNADPEPEFYVNADPELDTAIRIQHTVVDLGTASIGLNSGRQ
jgi:hypothetical protein